MEAVSTSETSVNLYETARRNISQDSHLHQPMMFEVLTALKILMLVFWVVMPCGLVGRHQRFGGACCLHRTSGMKMEVVRSSETLVSTCKSSRRYNANDQSLHQRMMPTVNNNEPGPMFSSKTVPYV
jgi:hypothetical protein